MNKIRSACSQINKAGHDLAEGHLTAVSIINYGGSLERRRVRHKRQQQQSIELERKAGRLAIGVELADEINFNNATRPCKLNWRACSRFEAKMSIVVAASRMSARLGQIITRNQLFQATTIRVVWSSSQEGEQEI